MKHTKDYWRRQNHKPPLPSHPDPPPTIQCSWYPHEGQCPYLRQAFICYATMVQNPDVMGYEGVKAAVAALQGGTADGAVTDTGVTVVTK